MTQSAAEDHRDYSKKMQGTKHLPGLSYQCPATSQAHRHHEAHALRQTTGSAHEEIGVEFWPGSGTVAARTLATDQG